MEHAFLLRGTTLTWVEEGLCWEGFAAKVFMGWMYFIQICIPLGRIKIKNFYENKAFLIIFCRGWTQRLKEKKLLALRSYPNCSCVMVLRQTQLLGFLGRSTAEGKCSGWLGVSANTKAWSLSAQSNCSLFSGACTWLNSLSSCTEMIFKLELFKLNTKTTQGKRKGGRRFLLRMYGVVSTFDLLGLSGTTLWRIYTSLPSCRSCPRLLGQWPLRQDMVSGDSGTRVLWDLLGDDSFVF